MSLDCAKCRYFMGYDGVGELWTSCSIHGDFKVQKTSCKHFKRPGRLMYLVKDDRGHNVALFFEKEAANNYVQYAKKECRYNDLMIIEKQLKIREVRV